jgi:hypothetical protein
MVIMSLSLRPNPPSICRLPRLTLTWPIAKYTSSAAAPGVVYKDALKADRESDLLRERRGHDHERQAVSRPVGECLGGVPCPDGLVFEPQLAFGVERLGKSLLDAAAVRSAELRRTKRFISSLTAKMSPRRSARTAGGRADR